MQTIYNYKYKYKQTKVHYKKTDLFEQEKKLVDFV